MHIAGKAQQALQMLLFRRLQDPKAEVKDVFIMAISYLGLQSEKDFNTLADGTSVNDLPDDQGSAAAADPLYVN